MAKRLPSWLYVFVPSKKQSSHAANEYTTTPRHSVATEVREPEEESADPRDVHGSSCIGLALCSPGRLAVGVRCRANAPNDNQLQLITNNLFLASGNRKQSQKKTMTPPVKECKMERDNQPKEKKRPKNREESFGLQACYDQQQLKFGKPAIRGQAQNTPNRVYAKANYCGLPFPPRLTSVTGIRRHAI